mmetsp:Transcript_11184/g.25044  ORF Transcript_11184/g.25044 Transcript_11184/m.25044 type:complete len:82 (-) Transcript_11184:127-372(-)
MFSMWCTWSKVSPPTGPASKITGLSNFKSWESCLMVSLIGTLECSLHMVLRRRHRATRPPRGHSKVGAMAAHVLLRGNGDF